MKNILQKQANLAQLQRRLKTQKGKQFWRSLEELADSDEFRSWLEKEFPSSPLEWDQPLGRRSFLKLMGASMALAGLNACTRQPLEKIHPYVQAPENVVPGKPLYFATALTLGGYASGVLVESHVGRPTKVEGNPEHPASLGGTDIFSQAAILELYDPDRSQVVKRAARISTWESFLNEMNLQLADQERKEGAGIRILTQTVTSPTLHNQLQQFLQAFPLAKWTQFEPVNMDNARTASQLSLGSFMDTHYDFDKADVIVSLGSDFLVGVPGHLRYARQFATRRNVDENSGKMCRLYVAESVPSLTGAAADHRFSLTSAEIEDFTASLARELGIQVPRTSEGDGRQRDRAKKIARDLLEHRSASVLIPGRDQAPSVHMLAHAMNERLNNVGRTLWYTRPVAAVPSIQLDSLQELAQEMSTGDVELLIMIGGNPAFNTPADIEFTRLLDKVNFRVHLSLYEDETSELSHWHIPMAHSLETWGDARAFDGTVTIMQPLIAPLYAGKSEHEFLAILTGNTGQTAYNFVREYWQTRWPDAEFEDMWEKAVHDGVVPDTAEQPIQVAASLAQLEKQMANEWQDQQQAGGLILQFRPDPTVWDGRFANNGWLQELPKPFTKLTWDNALLISPALAAARGLENGDLVTVQHNGNELTVPVWLSPGHPEEAITLHFGYGRTRTGNVGHNTGFDAYRLRSSSGLWSSPGAEITPVGQAYQLATTQLHHNMEGRHLVRSATLREYVEHPVLFHELGYDPPDELTLYPDEHPNEGYAWGMAVDINACIGCNGCTIACQAENNIAIVGKDQVIAGREMNWIRVDGYYEGEPDAPDMLHQPVLCMHCENAPCEVVCPVGATTHSPEGLNEMIYNRCVGTRYCSNNCPYKVRRFNFFLYSDLETASLKMMRNPDVTVRTRGVMEKCTYCVQRINHARIQAKKEDRSIRDGEIVTACQQVCPTDAIIFGDINDPNSRVSKLKQQHRNYAILTELGTRPRTSYLGKIKNPNPEMTEA